MPKIEIVFYRDDDGSVPVHDWLLSVKRRDERVFTKVLSRIALLQSDGHELRRPLCDYLRNGIYELRIGFGTVNYRILYFFNGRIAAILAHGIEKEGRIPDMDIERAVARKAKFERAPEKHSDEEH